MDSEDLILFYYLGPFPLNHIRLLLKIGVRLSIFPNLDLFLVLSSSSNKLAKILRSSKVIFWLLILRRFMTPKKLSGVFVFLKSRRPKAVRCSYFPYSSMLAWTSPGLRPAACLSAYHMLGLGSFYGDNLHCPNSPWTPRGAVVSSWWRISKVFFFLIP